MRLHSLKQSLRVEVYLVGSIQEDVFIPVLAARREEYTSLKTISGTLNNALNKLVECLCAAGSDPGK
ncbi:hypothetical protein SK128_021705, partial [Halocaridina rubra]